MLINDLFIVDDWRPGDGVLTALFRLQVNHRIFEGHFPGRPVVPGACLVQLVQEMASSVAGVAVQMIRADQIKFVAMIEPGREGSIMATVRGKWQATGEWRVDAEVKKVGAEKAGAEKEGATCFRFRGVFRAGSGYAG